MQCSYCPALVLSKNMARHERYCKEKPKIAELSQKDENANTKDELIAKLKEENTKLKHDVAQKDMMLARHEETIAKLKSENHRKVTLL